MVVHRVKIGGVVYGNVGSIDSEPANEYYYQVETLDGVLHEKIRYTKTNHTVQFFNLLDGVYDSLKAFIKANRNNEIVCGFPDGDGFVEKKYKLEITGERNKGYHNGIYYRNGLTVLFKAVTPDE